MNKLIIAEKPSVALRIALSLSDAKPKTGITNQVVYYEISRKGENLYVVPAAGHLFSLHQRQKTYTLPIFDIEWAPSYKVNKNAYFTKKYLDAIETIGRKCNFFINACDYDIEGTIIGSNLIKDIINTDVNKEIPENSANLGRMKFSTTTKPDLEKAYEEMEKFDYNNMYAGQSRHMLDWMWGINMSRVLMNSLYLVGIKKIMSIGRVQGPTLGILAKRELEIRNFESKPFWTVIIKFRGIDFLNKTGNIFEKEKASDALRETESNEVSVKDTSASLETKYPFPPFDLTSLQLEASRTLKMDPSRTLAVAQSLYEKSYISYPRTASQKLPATLNLARIISMMAQNPKYELHSKKLILGSKYRPREGAKEDEAHPAIYPTGELPKKMSDEEEAVYDLIAKRFLACFDSPATIANTRITLISGHEEYSASGNIVKEKGWMDIYNYYKPEENVMPTLVKGEVIKPDKIQMKEGKTEPPKRYTKASLIALLEKKDLGTKATRASIIDTLFNRGYILNAKIEVTNFGMSVFESLNSYCPDILDEDLTRNLEKDMERISKGQKSKDEIIGEGKQIITKIVETFKDKGAEIGRGLSNGLKESEMAYMLGKCTKCGKGDLIVKKSRNNKQFVGCSNWPDCDNSYPLPQYAKIVPMHKTCEKCGTPKVKVFAKGKVFEMCVDPNCETKKNWGSEKGTKSKPEIKNTVSASIAKTDISESRSGEAGSADIAKTTLTKGKKTAKKDKRQSAKKSRSRKKDN